jgi:hypothetical protein
MLTFIAFPLLILLAAVLLGFLFAALQKRAHRHDRFSTIGPSVELDDSKPPLPTPLRTSMNGDAMKLQRLIELERRLNPSASETDVELRAYARLRRQGGNN